MNVDWHRVRFDAPLYLSSLFSSLAIFALLGGRWFTWILVLAGIFFFVIAARQAKKSRPPNASPDGSHVDFDRDDPEWFVCKEHGHYIDSPEHHYVCGDRPETVVG